MSYSRLLVAVDDSPASLAAVRVAVDLAAGWRATIRAVTVLRDHALAGVLGHRSDGATEAGRRLAGSASSVLAWTADLAAGRGVACETVLLDGEPFRAILGEAQRWDAELIVMGRSDRRGPSSPYAGSETAHVLEFADRPVLVVPRPGRARGT